jgi:hypothetical protein
MIYFQSISCLLRWAFSWKLTAVFTIWKISKHNLIISILCYWLHFDFFFTFIKWILFRSCSLAGGQWLGRCGVQQVFNRWILPTNCSSLVGATSFINVLPTHSQVGGRAESAPGTKVCVDIFAFTPRSCIVCVVWFGWTITIHSDFHSQTQRGRSESLLVLCLITRVLLWMLFY